MGEKRKHSSAFQVGPANLPDGTRKRKAARIKQALIERAKIKQGFEKVKRRRLQEEEESGAPRRNVYADAEAESSAEADNKDAPTEPVSVEPHPDRQALIDGAAEPSEEQDERAESQNHKHDRRKRFKQDPYAKQLSRAQEQKEEADRRRQEREEAERQRQQKTKERERMQRLIKKAKRPTVDGKRKLGRESEVLLEKVKKMMKT